MKRRAMLQALASLSPSVLLRAQQPVVPPKPTPAAIEEIPVIESTTPDLAGSTVASFFGEAQFLALRRLSDLIVPTTSDVPGAEATGAAEFLDFLIGQSDTSRQQVYRRGLDELNSRSEQQFGIPFTKTTQAQADVILAPLRERWTATPDDFTAFLVTAKMDTLQATESSEDWIRIVSKRVRSAGGLGTYWSPIN